MRLAAAEVEYMGMRTAALRVFGDNPDQTCTVKEPLLESVEHKSGFKSSVEQRVQRPVKVELWLGLAGWSLGFRRGCREAPA